jgi:hypothetical protein
MSSLTAVVGVFTGGVKITWEKSTSVARLFYRGAKYFTFACWKMTWKMRYFGTILCK